MQKIVDINRYKQEDQLYSWLYQNRYSGAAAIHLLRFMGKEYMHCKRILDAGCGRQALAAYTYYWNPDTVIIGVDVSDYAIKSEKFRYPLIHTPIEAIPVPNNWFDGLFCSDVLEHVTQEDDKLVNSLKELRRVLQPGGIWGFSICCEPSVHKGPNGEELHVTVKPIEWWIETLKKYDFQNALQQKVVQRLADKSDSLTIFLCGK